MKNATVWQANLTYDLLITLNRTLIYFICEAGWNWLFKSIRQGMSLTSLSYFEGMTGNQPSGSSL